MSEVLEKLINENNGVLRVVDMHQAGISNSLLQRMTQEGDLERGECGLYFGADYLADLYLVVQYRCPKGTFSRSTQRGQHNRKINCYQNGYML